MGLAIFFYFSKPTGTWINSTYQKKIRTQPGWSPKHGWFPSPKQICTCLTHTQSLSHRVTSYAYYERKNMVVCFVMIISYLYHMKLYYVQLLGGPTICEVCRLLAPRVRPCGGSVAAGRRKTKHIAVVSQRRAPIAESQTAKPIKTLGIYWECMCTYAYIVIITG